MAGLTYDTGALLAAERSDRMFWALHEQALRRGVRPVVPAGVLAQAWRGGQQAQLSRMLVGCRVEDLDEAKSRAAGVACGASRTDDLIDATVVIGAIARGDAIVTSDPKDMRRIASALGSKLPLATV